MRSLAVYLLLVLFPVFVHAQELQVLHVVGKIEKVDDNELLKPGDKIDEDTRIRFLSENAAAAVLSKEKGKFILKPKDEETDDSTRGAGSDMVYLIKTSLTPVKGRMSTRGIGLSNELELIYYFTEEPYVWVGDLIKIKVSSSAFPMNDQHYFYVKYLYEGKERLASLDFQGDLLIFDKNKIFQETGAFPDQDIVEDFQLCYYYAEEDAFNYNTICTIDFVYLQTGDVQQLFNQLSDSSKYPYEDMADILSDLYGKSDARQLRQNLR